MNFRLGLLCSLFVLSLLFICPPKIAAIVDPLASPNNIYGIHVIDGNDLEDAAALVNSSGGEWGYITIVITDNDLNIEKWQTVFDRLRSLKLIPLVRIATHSEKGMWVAPGPADVGKWVHFLNSLNWVIKNRYVILFNEPNHAKEWGGKIDPAGYAQVASVFAAGLKGASDDFFILPAGFDAVAPNGSQTMEMTNFFKRMYKQDNEVFKIFDGWTSHSYPNPAFSGKVSDIGKSSVKGYAWELNYLSGFGLDKGLPVFITETGWVRKTQEDEEKIALKIVNAYKNVWNDSRIVAVTPFVLNYPSDPFDQFSWKKPNSDEFYPQYERVVQLEKVSGQPVQVDTFELDKRAIPDELIASSDEEFVITLKNTGQAIWDAENYRLEVSGDFGKGNSWVSQIIPTKPYSEVSLKVILRTPKEAGEKKIVFTLKKGDLMVGESIEKILKVIPPPSLVFEVRNILGAKLSGDDFSLYLSKDGQVKYRVENVSVEKGLGRVDGLYNVLPGQMYAFSLERKSHLLTSVKNVLVSGENYVRFPNLGLLALFYLIR